MTALGNQRVVTTPTRVGPVRWGITAFGGCVFACLVLMGALNLSRWALHKFDQFIDPASVIVERTP